MRLALLMMQKDESELLGQWIAYHAHLFGHDSLFIFDNGSTCPEVTRLLDKARDAGVHVRYYPPDYETFENKHEILGQAIRDLDSQDPCDFYFPMDCDEFLVLKRPFFRSLSFDGNTILRYLGKLQGTPQPLKIAGAYWNVPFSEDRFYFAKWKKVFFSKGSFQSMVPGYHRGHTVDGITQRLETRIAYLHFHNRPFEQLLKSARAKLKGRVASFERKDLFGYTGPGNHLIKYLLGTEQEYLDELRQKRTIKAKGFRKILGAHQLSYPYSKTFDKAKFGD